MSVPLVSSKDIAALSSDAERMKPDADGVHRIAWTVAQPFSFVRMYSVDDKGVITMGWHACRDVNGAIESRPMVEGRLRPYSTPGWAAQSGASAAPEGSYSFIGGELELGRDHGVLTNFGDFKHYYGSVIHHLREMHEMTTMLTKGNVFLRLNVALDARRVDEVHDNTIKADMRASQSALRGFVERYFPREWLSEAMGETPGLRPATLLHEKQAAAAALPKRTGAQ